MNNLNNNNNNRIKLLFLISVLFCMYKNFVLLTTQSTGSSTGSSSSSDISSYDDPSSWSSLYWSSLSLSSDHTSVSDPSSSLLNDKNKIYDIYNDDDRNEADTVDGTSDDASDGTGGDGGQEQRRERIGESSSSTTTSTTTTTTTTIRRKRTRIIHVMNTYTISNTNTNHNHNHNHNNNNNNNNNTNYNRAARARIQPFDQWSTIKSIERAIKHVEELNNNNNSRRRNNNNTTTTPNNNNNSPSPSNSPIIEVDFVCAIFETDLPYFLEEYENNNLPCHLTLLKRSTKTEYYNYRNNTNNTNNNSTSSANENENEDDDDVYNYHNFLGDSSPKELPFVQDIIDSAITDYYTRREEEEKKAQATKDNNSRNSRNVNTSRADADGTTDQDDLITDHDINDFYIMLTNSDIGLTKDFYQYLLPKLDHREALSINRITIKKTKSIDTISKQYYLNQYNQNQNNQNNQNQNENENENESKQNNNNDENYNNNVISSDNDNDNNNIGTTNTDTDTQLTTILLNEIDTTIQQNKGKIHPGKDCFIIHSTVLKRITIHNMFAGQTPWGNMYHSILMIMAANYTNYKSKQSYSNSLVDGGTNTGTYHIGSERKWNKGSPTKKKQLDKLLNKLYYSDNNNSSSSSSSSRYYKGLDSCGPSKHPGPYATLNRLNSCILWLPRSLPRFQNSSNNTTSSSIKNHTNNNYHNNNNNTTNVVIIVPNFVQPGYEEFYRNQINSRNLCSNQEKTNMSSWHFHSICPNTS